MDRVVEGVGQVFEAAAFLSHFKELEDPRQRGKISYPLDEVLLLALLAVLAGAETFVDVARFGTKKLGILRRFRPFRHGTPAHDHLGDIFAVLDAEAFQRCFAAWVASLTGIPAGVIAIDGKTSRRSYQSKGAKAPIHMVSAFAAEQKARGFADSTISQDTTVDADHGRIETRTTTVIHDIEWLQKRHDWPGLNTVVMVESRREIEGRIVEETRFYISSLVVLAHLLGPIVRAHWAVENSLHWVMDMVFRDDECRVRTDNAPANFTTIKHIAYNLLRRASGKDSMRLRRKLAAWDDDFLESLIRL